MFGLFNRPSVDKTFKKVHKLVESNPLFKELSPTHTFWFINQYQAYSHTKKEYKNFGLTHIGGLAWAFEIFFKNIALKNQQNTIEPLEMEIGESLLAYTACLSELARTEGANERDLTILSSALEQGERIFSTSDLMGEIEQFTDLEKV